MEPPFPAQHRNKSQPGRTGVVEFVDRVGLDRLAKRQGDRAVLVKRVGAGDQHQLLRREQHALQLPNWRVGFALQRIVNTGWSEK